MKKGVFIIMAMISSFAFADNCDHPRDDFDGLYCLNKVYQESDNELNKAYKELRGYLNSEEKQKLKETQLSWIKKRNNTCSLHKSGQFFVNLSCTTKTTVNRTNQLRDRIRECKATGCQPSKL